MSKLTHRINSSYELAPNVKIYYSCEFRIENGEIILLTDVNELADTIVADPLNPSLPSFLQIDPDMLGDAIVEDIFTSFIDTNNTAILNLPN